MLGQAGSGFTRSKCQPLISRSVAVVAIGACIVAGLMPAAASAAQRGTPHEGSGGVQRTTAQVQAADRAADPGSPHVLPLRTNPARGSLSVAPGKGPAPPRRAGAPRTALSSPFNFAGPALADAAVQLFPPDTQGVVGPSQFIVAINGRFRSYNKATGLADGALDANPDVFFASVMTPPVANNFTSDPHIRYDRLSQRWIIVMIDVPGQTGNQKNRVMVARSDGPVISAATVWTFFFFDQAAGGSDNLFADYPTLGVDANALYIGMNMFTLTGSFAKTNMYVVRKSSILGAGPIVVTRFDGAVGGGAGPFTPQGVDNFDPAATTGYFIGVDNSVFSRLDVRTVTNPAGTPTLSGDQVVTVPATAFPIPVDHLGNTGGANGRLDALDDRLFAAQMRGGQIWSAHDIGVTSAGVASATPTRDATRWYEVSVSGTPSLTQSGTLFDSAASNPKSYWIPSVAVSGQNIMAIGGSVAGLAHRPDTWFSGRLPSDPAGQLDTPTEYTATGASYNPSGDPGGARGRRWGDYSMTSVDPDDDMTMWTIQEYASSTNMWGTRIARLRPPGPATPASTAPSPVPRGSASTTVTVTGTSVAGSGFFDPGAGFAKRLQAAVGCGVIVNSATYVNPTSVQLDLDTTSAAGAGPCDVTVTNPDGQAATGSGILALAAALPAIVTDAASSVGASGATLNVTINPNGTATSYKYEYGPTTSFGTVIGPFSAGSGTTAVSQPGQAITGLAANTTYYYRACGNNAAPGPQTCGAVVAFTTSGGPSAPTALTGGASSISNTGASLSGTVNARGQATAYTFEYGTSTSFGSFSAVQNGGATTAQFAVSGSLTGLSPNTTYFYRLVATNATGTTNGVVMAFTTTGPPTAPVVSTGAASAITSTSATLSGTVNAEGSQTSFTFEYGTTLAFGSLSAIDNAGAYGGVQNVSLPISRLSAATRYYYRIVATNATGTTVGAVMAFNTP